jgi:hypothetical protein
MDYSKKPKTIPKTKMTDKDYYKEHAKHHSPKHIKAMKELEKKGLSRDESHKFVKKYIGK